jgi:hypothetical protein
MDVVNHVVQRLTADELNSLISQERRQKALWANNLNDAWQLLAEMPISSYNRLLPIHHHTMNHALAMLIARCYVEWKRLS